ncbi:MAG: DNA recombination protein RmuC [Alphaproteobacteria bacterium]|nr:DNA recombination protein RmuC [Alphaproteobacteria bacterium]
MNQEIILGNITLDPVSLAIGGGSIFILALITFLWRSARIKADYQSLNTSLDAQDDIIEKLEVEKKAIEEKFSHTQQELVRAQTEKEAFSKQIAQNREDLEKMEKKFEVQFENLAHKIFDEKTTKFKSQSQESLNELLNPLRDKLNDFHKKVDDSFGQQAKEQFALKEQIKMIVDVNEKMTLQAEGLANALKGDSKTQGDWGEIVLEKILEDSGLRKGVDYIVQGTGLGLKHAETGKTQKPDVIINLPENKHVILDSKVSLTHYERLHAEQDADAQETHLQQFLASVKQHVKDLEKRRYQDTDQLGTPDFVLMFMPIESAYMLALQQDRELHQFAWDKGVAIVCPSTLFSSLKTISSLWRLADQNRNAQEIAQTGGALYDKIVGFVGDMEALGRNLKTLENTYEGAMNKLSQGKGNILKRTEDMKTLGVKTSKSLPQNLIEESGEDESNDNRAA